MLTGKGEVIQELTVQFKYSSDPKHKPAPFQGLFAWLGRPVWDFFKKDIWVPKARQQMTQEPHKCQTQVKDPLVISVIPGPCQRLLTIVMGQDTARATTTPFPALGVIRTQVLQGSTPATEIMALLLSK